MLKIFAKLVVLLLAVAGGRLAYDKGLDLPPLVLKQVNVTGNWKVPPESIFAITGLEKGKSIYKQDLKFAAAQIMKEPGVVACSIKRGYFSTIDISITAAEPALLVSNGGLTALSREGMILPVNDQLPVLPLVSGRKFAMVNCFDRLRDPEIAYALEVYDALMATSPALFSRLSEINFGADDALRLYFSPAGTEVLLEKSDIADGIKRLAALEDSGLAGDTAVFDLRFGPVMIESAVKGENL
jgi:cell division septal protein FtsQ